LVSRTRPTIAAVVAKQWRRVKADESYVAQSESQISNREYANAIPRERWKRTRPVTTRSTQDRPASDTSTTPGAYHQSRVSALYW
jgi:hypothetical protein